MMAEADISDQLQPDTVLLVEDHEAYFNKIHKRDIKTMRVEVAEWLGDILGKVSMFDKIGLQIIEQNYMLEAL